MEAIVSALRDQHEELEGLLAGMAEGDWGRPAPLCPGWTVSDVVLHLAQTDEMVLASAEGRFEQIMAERLAASGVFSKVDEAVAAMVDAEREAYRPGAAAGPAGLLSRWRSSSRAEREALAACDSRQPLPWVVTPLPARTMATTRLSETWIHTHDVADALGVSLPPGDRLRHIARLAWRTIPYAFARAGEAPPQGPVALELTGPSGDAWTFSPDEPAVTTVTGPAEEFCLVAARRMDPAKTSLSSTGPDAEKVLALVRTYA